MEESKEKGWVLGHKNLFAASRSSSSSGSVSNISSAIAITIVFLVSNDNQNHPAMDHLGTASYAVKNNYK